MKDKKKIRIVSLSVLVAALAIGMTIVWINLKKSEKQNVEIQELIALEQEGVSLEDVFIKLTDAKISEKQSKRRGGRK